VLDGDPGRSPPKKGTADPHFSPHVLLPNGWMDQDATCREVDLSPGQIVLDGDPHLHPKLGHSPPIFGSIPVVAKRLDGSRCHLVGRYLGPGNIVLDGDPAPPKGAQPPLFDPYLLWPNGHPCQLLLSTC